MLEKMVAGTLTLIIVMLLILGAAWMILEVPLVLFVVIISVIFAVYVYLRG